MSEVPLHASTHLAFWLVEVVLDNSLNLPFPPPRVLHILRGRHQVYNRLSTQFSVYGTAALVAQPIIFY